MLTRSVKWHVGRLRLTSSSVEMIERGNEIYYIKIKGELNKNLGQRVYITGIKQETIIVTKNKF